MSVFVFLVVLFLLIFSSCPLPQLRLTLQIPYAIKMFSSFYPPARCLPPPSPLIPCPALTRLPPPAPAPSPLSPFRVSEESHCDVHGDVHRRRLRVFLAKLSRPQCFRRWQSMVRILRIRPYGVFGRGIWVRVLDVIKSKRNLFCPRPAPPCPVLPCPGLPCATVPCTAPPCPAPPCSALLCPALLRPALPYLTMPYLILPYLTLPPILPFCFRFPVFPPPHVPF